LARIEHSDAPSSVQQLQEAGKVVVGAAGAAAVDRARVEVDARSSRAAVELKALANAMRASASSLREQGHDNEAEIVDQVAARADRLAVRLASASTDDLVEDAKRLSQEAVAFARREPVLVMAGAFAIGLLIPKVLDAIGTKGVLDLSRSDKSDNDQSGATPPRVRSAASER
jgi:hypothetical protein